MKISIIIPAYNEAATIKEIIKRARCERPDAEIIVVDDKSSDGTTDVLKEIGENEPLTIIYHGKNMGKGACIRTALEHVKGDVIIIQDADLEYDPKDYPKLLDPILDGRADVVYGTRFLGGPHRVIYFWNYIGNKFLTFLSNMLNDLNLTDMETGFKVFRKEAIAGIGIRENRFGFEPEITAKLAKKRLRIYEVPISYSGRTYAEGKKIRWWNGLATIWHIIKYRFMN